MAERRKNKKKKEADIKGIDEKPSKEEYAVARYLKQKLPEKKTTLLGHKVEYFIASRAIDCLVESPWAKENKKGELNFSNRDVAVEFMIRLLEHKFFHRAKKIVVQKEPKKKKLEKEEKELESSKEKESKKSKAKSDGGDTKDGKKESEGADKDTKEKDKDNKEKDKDKEKEKKKEKKKIKLDMHLDQIFIDSNEPYVWIYDPIPLRTWITGTLMVVAAVLLCLFPLWPQTIRHYIYYVSVAAAFFLVFIIGLAFLRLVVFVILWVLTLGKHHLWLLPNLTEDVGFFESFWPLYKYEYKGAQSKGDKEKSSSSKEDKTKDSKESDGEEKEENEAQGEEENKEAEEEREQSQSEDSQGSDGDAQKTENGFEFLEAEEESEGEDRKTK